MTAKRTERKYEPCWNKLKKVGILRVRLTSSESPEVIKRHAKTFRKAVQKEKYNDEDFKHEFPFAELVSTVSGNEITMKLELNRPLSLEDL